jgi:TonB family protein
MSCLTPFNLTNRSYRALAYISSLLICVGKLTIVVSLLLSISLAQVGKKSDAGTLSSKSGVALEQEAIKKVDPVFPPIAKAARASGAVKVEVTIDAVGKVVTARAVSGHPLLRDSAEAAARQWKFKPTTVSGKRVKLSGVLTFNFTLDDGKKSEAEEGRANLDPSEERLDRGITLLESNRYDDAIFEFREAIRIKPDNFFAHYKLGVAYIKAGRYSEAETTCEQALILPPEAQRDDVYLSNVLMCVGLSKLYLGKYDDSIKALKRVADMNLEMVDVRLFLAMALRRKGDNEAAIVALKESVALKQTHNAYFLLGEIYLEQNRLKEAIDSYRKCIEFDYGPSIPLARYGLGRAYLRLGAKRSAMNEYQALKNINSPLAEQLLGEINK